jgi:zinc transport system ATP-binding protein
VSAPHDPVSGAASGRDGDDAGAGTTPEAPAVEAAGLTVRLGDVDVLRDVDFRLPASRFLTIIGPNGAGKSTLVKTLLGLIEPQRGAVRLFGRPAGRDPDRVGYVPQLKTFDRSFPATALELVVSGLRRSWPARIATRERQAACEALERVGAERLTDRPLARLSGGELQRAYLARALVRRPDLVVLDEPATGVDFLAEHDLNRLLDGYRGATRATVVMVTHDLAAARHHATDVLVLNRTVVGFGPPEVALSDHCLERAYGHVGHGHPGVLP